MSLHRKKPHVTPSTDDDGPADCAGWEVVCPDGRVRHLPYHNRGDAAAHARTASDPERFARRRSCRLAPKPGRLKRDQPPCSGGPHVVRPILFQHARPTRGRA